VKKLGCEKELILARSKRRNHGKEMRISELVSIKPEIFS
jgi:hypothetical protein